ncbi:related to Glycerol uptake protein 1 [Hanseniaspora guilliermondii]|uniref:Related to Glycerol uptake protein 1 n=1 Tax=Hanseniaspora guilliermondii TaxID=56406 RepID=A0A1L0CMS9_9ASCO|nr:related to Glycerol uptake protein 1 [Hanseniaspora guilliermondii]
MSILSLLQGFFGLTSLDHRIQPKKNVSAQPSKWKSLEFKLYIALCFIVVPNMFYTTIKATSEYNQNYQSFSRLLSNGWIFGRKVDNSDQQYSFFRNNFLLLGGVATGHVLLKKLLIEYLLSGNKRIQFDFVFGFVFLFVLHGINMIKILFLIGMLHGITYIFIKQKQHKVGKPALFFFGVGTLFFNVKFRKWRYGDILTILGFMDSFYKGIVARWDVFYNFMLLRVLSYELDLLEAEELMTLEKKEDTSDDTIELLEIHTKGISTKENIKLEPITNDAERMSYRHNIKEYNFVNQFAYLLYAPLLIAGPVITFNDYLCQNQRSLPNTMKFKVIYLLRFLFCFLTMEVLLHYTYVVALSKFKAWERLSSYQISMIGLFNLNLVWLKLLIPWRFFRLWSLMDNIDPPENMLRCMNNNFSALQFWRSWHRSFNKWVLRYIYIPLGGSKNRLLASFCVFTFVAIWHDIELKLLLWGWMIVLFLIPEIFLSSFVYKMFGHKPKTYRLLTGAGCVVNVWMMMIANIFGFCLGQDGTKKFLNDLLFTTNGLIFFFASSGCLFIAIQVMFELREQEKRAGIDAKC